MMIQSQYLVKVQNQTLYHMMSSTESYHHYRASLYTEPYLRTIDIYALDVIYLLTQNDIDSWLV